ncbi:hypothetical protein LVJ83_01345 [Uruburuella testudinis]|uniref:Uncharacterized protein n=1 Tax=Uruburuella testudinis TaxID=1282863 RepID=A0ABY4DUM3_9NEIS|nr:hypothetical protein [Uruburuella testudinis]UOO82153.1 hypothetical protein LVJ83_01345 [Uruburuella testudinis]
MKDSWLFFVKQKLRPYYSGFNRQLLLLCMQSPADVWYFCQQFNLNAKPKISPIKGKGRLNGFQTAFANNENRPGIINIIATPADITVYQDAADQAYASSLPRSEKV